MVRVRVLETIKWEGARHGPGSILDIPDVYYHRAARVDRVEIIGDDTPGSHSDQAIDAANAFIDAGLTEAQAEALIVAGYDSLDAAKAASDDELDEVDGIGPATVKKIREA